MDFSAFHFKVDPFKNFFVLNRNMKIINFKCRSSHHYTSVNKKDLYIPARAANLYSHFILITIL
ncbi:Uncharacterised protein [Mycobacteroides abscessus subsp. abscessus]|nr:Uncharacterised protein [Mycobacteroides abscessus subsp. abscessus]